MHIKRRTGRKAAAAALAIAAMAVPAPAAAAEQAASPSHAFCRAHQLPVRLSTNGPVHTVYAELCARRRPSPTMPVQVLLHGGTYDHAYWDWPVAPRRYSYVEHATRAGFATLNVDRLGYGRSDHPDPTALDFPAAGYVTSQVVRHLRRGVLGTRFRTVVLNGHSMGGIAARHAAAGGGVDAMIISGIPPRPGPEGSRSADPDFPFYPAELDPKFAGKPWAPGYLTTRPGTRPRAFLAEGTYEPVMAWAEEHLKDTLTVAELRSVRPGGTRQASPPAAPGVPVLHVLGRYDAIACQSTRDCTTDPAAEGAEIIRNSGHSINVSLGARRFYQRTIAWLSAHGIR